MKLSAIIIMIVAVLVGLVGLFAASRAAAYSFVYYVGLTTSGVAVLLNFLLIKWHFDEKDGLNTGIPFEKRIIAIIAAAIWSLLLYQYVVAQWQSIVKPEWSITFPVAIVFFLVLSGVLSCLEASIANVHKLDLDSWLESKSAPIKNILAGGSADPALQRELDRYIQKHNLHAAMISSKQRKEEQTTFLLTVITGLDVVLTVLYVRALIDLNDFPPDARVFFVEWFPFGGTSGFVSVGITLMMLLLVGILPNKIAIRKTVECLMSLSWIIRVCDWLRVPPAVVNSLAMPIDVALDFARIKAK